jgi:hypothetical protein
MDGLPEDVVAKSRIHAVAGHKVHTANTQATLQMLLNSNQVEQRDRATELHEYVHVTIRSGLVASH